MSASFVNLKEHILHQSLSFVALRIGINFSFFTKLVPLLLLVPNTFMVLTSGDVYVNL